jgi:hypothetical protein
LFFYDLARFIVTVAIMTQLGNLSLSDGSYPYLVYASAQALFPIITWFIYSDPEPYLVYLPLNIAGKCISILLSGIWAFFTISELSPTMPFPLFVCLGLTLIIMFTDIISILGMIFIKKGFEKIIQDKNDQNDNRIIGGIS